MARHPMVPILQTQILGPQKREHFPPVSQLVLKSRFLPSKKKKTIPLSQPQVLKSLLCRNSKENC